MATEMTKIDKVIEGLRILQSLGATWTWAAHDEIGVEFESGENPVLSESQQARMDELGWFVDSEADAWATFT